jgi:glycosyltransferase involved in cell wall biosynthesis
VELESCTDLEAAAFREKHGLNGRPVVGICTRLAAEKGVEVLLRALPLVQEAFPDVIVLHAGQYQNVLGEEAYAARLAPLFEKYKETYHLLGNLNGSELTAFFKNLDCLVMCSLNSTESFGLVQIEAMTNSVPVAACALPGVRQPVTMTGMGKVTAVNDHHALALAIIDILRHKERYIRSPQLIADSFKPDQTAAEYEKLFIELMNGRTARRTAEPAAYDRLRAMRDQFNHE